MMLWVISFQALCLQGHWVTTAFLLGEVDAASQMATLHKQLLGMFSPEQELLCAPFFVSICSLSTKAEIVLKVCPVPSISWAPRRRAPFSARTQKGKQLRPPHCKVAFGLGEPGAAQAPSSHTRHRGALGCLALLWNQGVYWNSGGPFLLFDTKSHGRVFSVLFFSL